MPLTFENDTAIHEAGHCILSYLANDFFEIKFVTTDLGLSKAQDVTSLGGLKGRLIKDGESLTFEEHDIMILMGMAGMAADDINHCDCKLDDSLYDNSTFVCKLSSNKYSGYFRMLLPHLQRITNQLSVGERAYTTSCQKLLHELFITEWLRDILLELRDKIDSATNSTLTGDEINAYLDNSKLRSWKGKEWKKIIIDRKNKFKKQHHKTAMSKLFYGDKLLSTLKKNYLG